MFIAYVDGLYHHIITVTEMTSHTFTHRKRFSRSTHSCKSRNNDHKGRGSTAPLVTLGTQ